MLTKEQYDKVKGLYYVTDLYNKGKLIDRRITIEFTLKEEYPEIVCAYEIKFRTPTFEELCKHNEECWKRLRNE